MINTKVMRVKGFAGTAPEVRTNSTTGEQFAVFSLGVPVGSKDNQGVEWMDINCGSHLFEVIAGITVGKKVIIVGIPSVSKVTKDGVIIGVKQRIRVEEIDYDYSSGQEDPAAVLASQPDPTSD